MRYVIALCMFTSLLQGANHYDWTIIGGGPAGITVVGVLLDLKINPRTIMWVDPEFGVGRLGKYYRTVTANTKTKMFVQYLTTCKTFSWITSPAITLLKNLDLDKEYPLETIVNPLCDITTELRKKITSLVTSVERLDRDDKNKLWNVVCGNGCYFTSKHVVLALGAHPRNFHYTEGQYAQEVCLDEALNKKKLSSLVGPDETVAVIGSSHSAVLMMKFLNELNIARIINFYKRPLYYVQNLGTWFLHGENGLQGTAAEWAKNILEPQKAPAIIRIPNSKEAREHWLTICSKIIYASGFEPNRAPLINGSRSVTYNDTNGYIAPGLFGIGIAFPERYEDPIGNVEHRVGLNDFFDYAQRIIPFWIKETQK